MLKDLRSEDDPQIAAIVAVIDHVAPDVLVLTDIDFDAGHAALHALSVRLRNPYPHVFSAPPNAGIQTGLDLDGDGFTGDARDALGYGRFRGDGGMAVLSRHPIRHEALLDFTDFLWRDVPGAELPRRGDDLWPSANVFEALPVSSTNHWVLPIEVEGTEITLLVMDATPPVFDGPEDFNGLRNRDELRLFEAVLDGALGPIPVNPILIGTINADPADGEGQRDTIANFLTRPDLQDPLPKSAGGGAAGSLQHLGDPAFDTVDWPEDGPGNLRVSYVLPFAAAKVVGAGVFWPAPDDPLSVLLGSDGMAAGAHRLVWVDIMLDGAG